MNRLSVIIINSINISFLFVTLINEQIVEYFLKLKKTYIYNKILIVSIYLKDNFCLNVRETNRKG